MEGRPYRRPSMGSAFLETVGDAAVPDEVPEGTVPYGLTPRETDGLRQLLDSRSDRQIDAALSISHRTVMRHVEHILAKFDVDSGATGATQTVALKLL